LKAWGNKVIEVVGGRPVHPVGFRVGGMHRVVTRHELLPLLKKVGEMKRKAKRFLEFVMSLPIPEIKYDMVYACIRNGERYPILEGRVVTSDGLEFPEDAFEEYVEVEQMRYSNSLRYKLKGGKPYVVGPSARYNLNFDLLMPEVRDMVKESGYEPPLKNTYQSIVARAAETYHAVLEIEELISTYKEPERPYVEGEVRAGEAAAITEAPRGMLYHKYRIDEDGKITYANIVAPTCQNYAAMEEDIRKVAPLLLSKDPKEAQWIAEQTIRNYDPCISCSVHAIRLHLMRS
ncbi:MAG: nickel-dependent hydrogenase large subunit, partial [Desulfurococcales archaeon]|nr:nickel-dependent hydrogenase large subunit [Desulfurococcales archaeon]